MDKSKRFVLVSIIVLLYFIFIVLPWADDRGFFSAGSPSITQYQGIYSLMVFPVIVCYLTLLIFDFKHLRNRAYVYPLIVFTFFISFMMAVITAGGAMMFLVILLVIPVGITMLLISDVGDNRDREGYWTPINNKNSQEGDGFKKKWNSMISKSKKN